MPKPTFIFKHVSVLCATIEYNLIAAFLKIFPLILQTITIAPMISTGREGAAIYHVFVQWILFSWPTILWYNLDLEACWPSRKVGESGSLKCLNPVYRRMCPVSLQLARRDTETDLLEWETTLQRVTQRAGPPWHGSVCSPARINAISLMLVYHNVSSAFARAPSLPQCADNSVLIFFVAACILQEYRTNMIETFGKFDGILIA